MCPLLKIAARDSPLSRAQVREVFDPLGIPYEPRYIKSHGDLDLKTSLRTLDKTDFFTREIDALVLAGECDLAVHSAKDLPEPIAEGLYIVALTQGLDPADSLVLREGETLDDVRLVATSSARREEAVLQLILETAVQDAKVMQVFELESLVRGGEHSQKVKAPPLTSDYGSKDCVNLASSTAVSRLNPHVSFCDIRGPIHERLQKLYQHEVDGVVIAEAALLRLQLNPNRLRLPGATAPLQGRLALVARHGRTFPFLTDTRLPETLYLGLRCPNPLWHHFPIIETVSLPFKPVPEATHYIFTSQTAVHLYKPYLTDKPIFAVGKATAKALAPYPVKVASIEQAEGVIDLLQQEDLSQAHIVWPRSALARPILSEWLAKYTQATEIPLYTTRPTSLPKINPTPFKKIIFTSPSTVTAYRTLYGALPTDKELIPLGPITADELV